MEKEADNALEHPKLISTSIGARDSALAAANFSKYQRKGKPLSSTEKMRQLPRRMWMIVATACITWAIVIAIGYTIFA